MGDNDPIDAIEFGTEGKALPMGSIVRAKVLGSLALIDEGIYIYIYVCVLVYVLVFPCVLYYY